jgi:hypothetical protein
MDECHCGHCEVENAGQRLYYAQGQTQPKVLNVSDTAPPWEGFLLARLRLIRHLASEGRSDREIKPLLSITQVAQVTLLREGGGLPSSGVDARAGAAGPPRSFKATYRRRPRGNPP